MLTKTMIDHLKIVSQNVRMVDLEVLKLDHIFNLMLENNVDAFLIQETWLIGSGIKVVIFCFISWS